MCIALSPEGAARFTEPSLESQTILGTHTQTITGNQVWPSLFSKGTHASISFQNTQLSLYVSNIDRNCFPKIQFHTFFFFRSIVQLFWNCIALVFSSYWPPEMCEDPVPLFLLHGLGIAKKSLQPEALGQPAADGGQNLQVPCECF